MIKKIILSLLATFLFLISIYFDLIVYGLTMGYNQVKIVMEARPITEMMQDSTVSDSIKIRLRYIQSVKRFAIDSLGLNPSDNYETVYDQQGQDLLWNLSASQKYKLEAKRWSFPIAGSFPYKGFFNLDMARAEARELAKTHDVRIRSVGGWSTLGWFTDPILSNMLKRSDGSLANLVIHELTHSTLFIEDDIKFNENLASFVGDNGAKLFLQNTFGDTSRVYQNYLHSDSDYSLFVNHILRGAEKLDSLYSENSFELLEDSLKDELKSSLIKDIVISIDTIRFYNKDRFKITANFKPNNAYFMTFKRYNEDQNSFEEEFKTRFNSNFNSYLNYLKKSYGK